MAKNMSLPLFDNQAFSSMTGWQRTFYLALWAWAIIDVIWDAMHRQWSWETIVAIGLVSLVACVPKAGKWVIVGLTITFCLMVAFYAGVTAVHQGMVK